MKTPSLYDFPEIYGTLLAPEEDLLEDLDLWVEEHLEGDVESVMDPACGPGGYLLPYAEAGCRVAGNDLRACMIDSARATLCDHDVELTRGDMVDLSFRSGPFDLAVNLSSSVGHLKTDKAVVAHLKSVARHLRPGALYLLGVVVRERAEAEEDAWLLWQSEPTELPSGGLAAVRYESILRAGRARKERIRVFVLSSEVDGCPQAFQEEYDLRTFPVATVHRILKDVGEFDLLAAYDMFDEERAARPLGEGSGDATLVLRRR